MAAMYKKCLQNKEITRCPATENFRWQCETDTKQTQVMQQEVWTT